MIANNKILFNLDNLMNRQPITADIFLNSACNNKCPYCTYARYQTRGNKYMTIDEFIENMNILIAHNIKGVILTGGGEPTINPDFDKITAYLEFQKIPYGINTNFNIFKAISPNYLKISLDGYDKQSYLRSRGVDKYETVIQNIEKFLEFKAENGSKTTVGIQTVATNLEDVKRFYKAHKHLMINYFNIRPMESTCGEYYKEICNAAERIKILEYLQEINQKDSRVIINYKWHEINNIFDKCYANSLQIAINENSEVMYCCHKPYEIIGKLNDEATWHKREQFQTNMNMCDVPCRLTAPNETIKTMLNTPSDSAFI